ncbi:MAG: endo-1,4-beta-xylanase [Clostridia bacterium]|nr:endo-1,4-beta-xylanase [Clostridia bacterium]
MEEYNRRKVIELFDAYAADWKPRAAAGIEKYRKGDAVVTVRDKDGRPVPGARIKFSQKTHEFRFGANIFMLDELESEEKNEKYKKIFAQTFNMATLPFYWDTLEPVKGSPRYAKDSPKIYRRPPIDLCVEFCEKHGIEPREHALAYDHFFPAWLAGAGADRVKPELERRFREISERYAKKIPTIEVTNEMAWTTGKTLFYDDRDYIEWCFRTAEKYFPDNELGINESTLLAWGDKGRATDKYYAYIEAALLKGARIDAIGMQYHLFNRREVEYERTRLTLDPLRLYRQMDLYSDFGKPLQVTEVTVPAFSAEPEDEAIQAEILENVYTVWFSHPNVEQIIYWNLVDGYAHFWDPDPEKIRATQGDMTIGENYYYGGLLHFDMTPKPAFLRLRELIYGRWRTDAEAGPDGDGRASFRGFFGGYEGLVEAEGKRAPASFNLSKKGENRFELTL